MKRVICMSALIASCMISTLHARLWVHNKSQYYIQFTAETTVGDETVRVSPGKAGWAPEFKYDLAIYKKFTIYHIAADGKTFRKVYEQNVKEGGNRRIVVKDKGTPDSIYISTDQLELRIRSTWGTKAKDDKVNWL